MNLKKGDVFFILNKRRWLSRAIAWFMKSKWSHCGIIREVTPECVYTIETSDMQVWIGDFNDYIVGEYNLEVWRPTQMSQESIQMSVNTAKKLEGEMYGYLQLIFGFSISRLLKRIGIKFPNPIRQGIVCCGVVFYAYFKKAPGFDVDPERQDTEELYQLVVNNPKHWALVLKG